MRGLWASVLGVMLICLSAAPCAAEDGKVAGSIHHLYLLVGCGGSGEERELGFIFVSEHIAIRDATQKEEVLFSLSIEDLSRVNRERLHDIASLNSRHNSANTYGGRFASAKGYPSSDINSLGIATGSA
jgi:hypothetical protein